MIKEVMDENQQPSIQQELERLFSSTRGGGKGGESRDLHRVGADESSASTTTDTNTSFALHFTTKRRLLKYWDQKLVETPSKSAIFFHVKPSGFRFVTWFMSIHKFSLPRLSLEVFQTRTKTELF